MGATDDHESLVLTRSCIQGFFFFFPADAVTVFGAETTGLAPFSEQARQTGLTTLYWRFISSFTSASGSVLPHLQQIRSKFFARIILLFHWITAWNILAYNEDFCYRMSFWEDWSSASVHKGIYSLMELICACTRRFSWSIHAPPLATAHTFNCVTHLLFCEVSLPRLVLLGLCPRRINLYSVLAKGVIKGFVMLLGCIHELRVWKPRQLSKLEEWKAWGTASLTNRHSNDLADEVDVDAISIFKFKEPFNRWYLFNGLLKQNFAVIS